MAKNKNKKKKPQDESLDHILRSIAGFDEEEVSDRNTETLGIMQEVRKSFAEISDDQAKHMDIMIAKMGEIPKKLDELKKQDQEIFSTIGHTIVELEKQMKNPAISPEQKKLYEEQTKLLRKQMVEHAHPITHPKNIKEAVGLKYFGITPQTTRKHGLIGGVVAGMKDARKILSGKGREMKVDDELDNQRKSEEYKKKDIIESTAEGESPKTIPSDDNFEATPEGEKPVTTTDEETAKASKEVEERTRAIDDAEKLQNNIKETEKENVEKVLDKDESELSRRTTKTAKASREVEKWAADILKELKNITDLIEPITNEALKGGSGGGGGKRTNKKNDIDDDFNDDELATIKRLHDQNDPTQARVEEPEPTAIVAEEESAKEQEPKIAESTKAEILEELHEHLPFQEKINLKERGSASGTMKLSKKQARSIRNQEKKKNTALAAEGVHEPIPEVHEATPEAPKPVEATPEAPKPVEAPNPITEATAIGGEVLGAEAVGTGAAGGASMVGGVASTLGSAALVGGAGYAAWKAGSWANKHLGLQSEGEKMNEDVEKQESKGLFDRENMARQHGFNSFREMRESHKRNPTPKNMSKEIFESHRELPETTVQDTTPTPPSVVNNYNTQSAPPAPASQSEKYIRPVHPSIITLQEGRVSRILNAPNSI